MIVDADTHINEPMELFETFLEEPYRSRRPIFVKDTLGLTRILLEGKLFPETRLRQVHRQKTEGMKLAGSRAGATDGKARLDDLEIEGIDVQVLFGSVALAVSSILDGEFQAAMCRALNNYYADFASADPKRLKPFAVLPVRDIPAAVEEIKRARKELGMIGFVLPPNVDGKNLDSPDFYPIYEQAEKLNAPIAVHWGNGSHIQAAGTERFDSHFMVHLLGHPFEQMIALASMITGGIYERFPKLRVGHLESGCGWLPYWLQRLDEHFERRGPEMPLLKREPREYFETGNIFVAAESDECMLPAVIQEVGADALLFGSDYPHTDGKFPNSVKFMREHSGISEKDADKMLTNGARWLGLQ